MRRTPFYGFIRYARIGENRPVALCWSWPVGLAWSWPMGLCWSWTVGLAWSSPMGLAWSWPMGLAWSWTVGLAWSWPMGLAWSWPWGLGAGLGASKHCEIHDEAFNHFLYFSISPKHPRYISLRP